MHIPWLIFLAMLALLGAISALATRFWTSPIATLPQWLKGVAQYTWLTARRTVIFIIGASVVIVGIAMIVLPGPAFIVIPLGLAILATEFLWARVLLKKAKDHVKNTATKIRDRKPRSAHSAKSHS